MPPASSVAHDLHVEMRLAFGAVAGMADVLGGIVTDHQVPRGEAVTQPLFELPADDAGHAGDPLWRCAGRRPAPGMRPSA